MTNILAVCVPEWYGVRRALQSYTSLVVSPDDAITEIDRHRPKVVLFGCYMPEWERILAFARRRGCVTVLTWYASYVLNEMDAINRKWMTAALRASKAGLFDHIAVPLPGLASAWTQQGYPTDYLPLTLPNIDDLTTEGTRYTGIHIGILGSGQPWKNMECQVVAASLIPGATIHVQHANLAVTEFSANVCVHSGHMDDAAYRDLVRSMTVNMCVSLSETYSYLTAESLMMGTPVLASHITPILRDLPPGHVLAPCRTPWFDDPYQIAQDLRAVIGDRHRLGAAGRPYMQSYNRRESFAAETLREKWYATYSRRHCVGAGATQQPSGPTV